jgi:hypothetical protein
VSSSTINDIEMDHFGLAIDYLATKGLGPCIGFIVLSNNCQHIFIEHRSDIYFPRAINLDNVRLCFNNIAQHTTYVKHLVW